MADERDSFWDIEKLLPKTKAKRPSARFDTTGVDITLTSDSEREQILHDRLKLTGEVFGVSRTRAERLLYEYTPDNAFIKKTGVYTQDSSYRYYEDFERAMHKYMRLTVRTAERAPFFSYVPQYSQLSPSRLSWYLYWRSGCRQRSYMPTDYSYVLLYVFELLNFDRPKYPERMIEELCSLWRAYRGDYPQLDRCMPDWVCDYCLIHRVSLPYDIVCDFIDAFLPHTSLREFYLGAGESSEGKYACAVIMGASGYNYKKSKYYTAENKAMYDEHILSAASYAVRVSSDKFRGVCDEVKGSVVRRDAYAGALCTSTAKRILTVEYLPLYRSGDLRLDATLATKYAENRLRALLGIRSRLSVVGISDSIKNAIDSYFVKRFGAYTSHTRGYARDDESESEYMAYYEAPAAELEFDRAMNIEEESWETAALMGESFDEDVADIVLDELEIPSISFDGEQAEEDGDGESEDEDDFIGSLDPLSVSVLKLIAHGNSKEAARMAISGGGFISDICERINESAIDCMGDVIIECDAGEYHIIEDYESEVMKWLKI